MSNAAKLKKRAIELEQKKQFDKALPLYVQFLNESDGTLDDADLSLYNRVGDLMLRVGNVPDALNYYEKAVDLYAERGFHNNAIALCNKVLRQSPGRSSIYYKLGRISATKGFKSDAKKNFLEYADRMQKAGQIDEAFRALKEFAELCPDQDDIRLMLAEQLSKENRQAEALEQLQKLHEKLEDEGRAAEARATVDRMKSIDPNAVPRASGSYRPQKSSDLIFLDVSYEDGSAKRKAPPPRRQMSDPDLIAITLADQPVGVTPMEPMRADAFPGVDAGPAGAPEATDAITMIDLDDALGELPSAGPAVADASPAPAGTASADAIDLATIDASPTDLAPTDLSPTELVPTEPPPTEPAPIEALGTASFVSDPGADLAFDVDTPLDASAADFFDFRSPPRSDAHPRASAPEVALDPDVAFPSLDAFDTELPSADEVTSGGALAAALDGSSTLDLPLASVGDLATGDGFSLNLTSGAEALYQPDAAPAEPADSETSAVGGTLDLQSDLAWLSPPADADAAPVADTVPVADLDALVAEELEELTTLDASANPVADGAPAWDGASSAGHAGVLSTELDEPSAPTMGGSADASEREDSGERGVAPHGAGAVAESEIEAPTDEAEWPSGATDRPSHAEPRSELEELRLRIAHTPEDWNLRRRLAECLLALGERAEGIRELEQVASQLEHRSDLEGAQVIVEELIRLAPDSIRRHQKRVELAFRANDRPKLIDAYMDLGDVLFRSGEQEKARAVYHRVLELAPDDPRCRAALAAAGGLATPPASRPAPAAPQRPSHHPVNAEREPSPVRSGGDGAAGNGAVADVRHDRRPHGSATGRNGASDFVDLGEWLRSDEGPKSTRMVTEEKPPTGDEQADFQEMLKKFKQGVAENVDEEDFESHYDLGVAYKEMGLIDEAVAEFQKALRGTEHRVRAYEALGQCFVEKEQFQVAASVLSRAIGLAVGDDHQLVGVLYLLGRATEALNNPGTALDYYQRVFAVDIEFRDVAERMRAIERKAT